MAMEKWLNGPLFPERHAMTDKIEAKKKHDTEKQRALGVGHNQDPHHSTGGGPGFWVGGCATVDVVGGLPGGP